MWSDVEGAGATLKIRPGGPRGKKHQTYIFPQVQNKFVSHHMSIPVARSVNSIIF